MAHEPEAPVVHLPPDPHRPTDRQRVVADALVLELLELVAVRMVRVITRSRAYGHLPVIGTDFELIEVAARHLKRFEDDVLKRHAAGRRRRRAGSFDETLAK